MAAPCIETRDPMPSSTGTVYCSARELRCGDGGLVRWAARRMRPSLCETNAREKKNQLRMSNDAFSVKPVRYDAR